MNIESCNYLPIPHFAIFQQMIGNKKTQESEYLGIAKNFSSKDRNM